MQRRILVLDGGMGTLVQGHGLTEADYRGEQFAHWPTELRGCNDLLALTRPDVISGIHEAYLQAGADIVSTDSFNATAISLADYGLETHAREINRAAAALARKMADKYTLLNPSKPRFVAGSMGPTGKSVSMSPDVSDPGARAVTFDQLQEAYAEQARGLVEGGADVLLVETIFDTLNAKAALKAIESTSRELGRPIPVMVSGTITDASGRILSGQTIDAFAASVMHAEGLLSIGLNCAFGAEQLRPYVEQLGRKAPIYVSAHPNAGLPNVMGEYDQTPAAMAAHIEQYLAQGLLNIVGGCCGTTPTHIALVAQLAAKYEPRRLPAPQHATILSGLEALQINHFVNIGERTNVAGSAKFVRLIRENRMDEALAVAREQVEAGAQIIDVCMDDGLIDGPAAMTRFLNLLAAEPDIARVPLMIDSSCWEVLEAGLKCAQGKSVVNSISLKEGEAEFLRRAAAIRGYGAAVVVMLFDERGQADSFERKVEVAARAYNLLIQSGFPPEDIIFDPNVLAVATGIEEHDGYGVAFIEACRWIKANLPHARLSGGISNLSFAFRGNNPVREAMHAVFLHHAIAAGLDMAIVNPSALPLYADIDPVLLALAEDVVLNRRPDAAEKLMNYAAEPLKTASTAVSWREGCVRERIEHAMLKGVADHVAADALEAYRELKDPLQVIDTLLMPAMEQVGRLFGEGRMFLPQVVKSARVMKAAVAALEPYIAEGVASQGAKGRLVLATVRGDVHDIGKNIVAVVMACNGFAIDDLGVMVEPEAIVDAAIAARADAIGLSGLITPSLEEMIRVVELLQHRGATIPVMIGGATTSALHTAVKIAPRYSEMVVHTRDASDGARVLGQLLGTSAADFADSLKQEQAALREQYERSRALADLLPLTEARKRKYVKRSRITPREVGRRVWTGFPLAEVIPQIDWRFFNDAWEVKEGSAEAADLRRDAEAMLAENPFTLGAAVGIFPAFSRGDDMVVRGERGDKVLLPMLRNQQAVESVNRSLADYLLPEEDYICLFALGVQFAPQADDYRAMLAKLLADRLTEALAEVVHQKVRTELWGFEGGTRYAFGYPACPDHSLKHEVFGLLDVERELPLRLTENFMIAPGEALCGMILPDPNTRFFAVGPIDQEQLKEYAARRSMSVDDVKRLIPNNLA